MHHLSFINHKLINFFSNTSIFENIFYTSWYAHFFARFNQGINTSNQRKYISEKIVFRYLFWEPILKNSAFVPVKKSNLCGNIIFCSSLLFILSDQKTQIPSEKNLQLLYITCRLCKYAKDEVQDIFFSWITYFLRLVRYIWVKVQA